MVEQRNKVQVQEIRMNIFLWKQVLPEKKIWISLISEEIL